MYTLVNKYVIFFIFLLLITVLYNCNTGDGSIDDYPEYYSLFEKRFDSLNTIKSKNKVIFLLPTPTEILEYIEYYDISYLSGLTNSPSNHKLYLSDKVAALNLGIYISDLSYMSIYKKNNESLEYIEVIEILMNQLRLTHAIGESALKEIKDRYNIQDSLNVISNDIFDHISEYLKNRELNDLMALISIGGYIESLYLTINSMKHLEDSTILSMHINDQKYLIAHLYHIVKPTLNNNYYKEELNRLEELKTVFDQYKDKYELIDIIKEEDNKIKLISRYELITDDNIIRLIEDKTTEIRNSIIN